jgi:Ion channel
MKLAPGKAFIINKHAHLLAVILFIFFSSPYINHIHPKIPVITPLFLLALLFILRTLGIRRRVFWISAGMGALVFILQLTLNLSYGSPYTVPLTMVLCSVYSVFLLFCILLLGAGLFKSARVTLDTIVGGINIYFLLGFLWTFFYFLIYCMDGQAFHLSAAPSITYFFCFSFSTLATIGFGDMFPVNKGAMILACLEGMTGQLYLAIFIARLVSLYANRQTEQKRVS